MADSGQRIATKSLALLCKGRGGDIFNDLAIQDKRFEDVAIMRPFNEFLSKEVIKNIFLRWRIWIIRISLRIF